LLRGKREVRGSILGSSSFALFFGTLPFKHH
jgi:hypothetical protein